MSEIQVATPPWSGQQAATAVDVLTRPGVAGTVSEGLPGVVAVADEVARLDRVVERVVDALLGGAITTGQDVGWPTWELSPEGRPTTVRAGHPALYDGDAGVAWALAELGTLTGRAEAVELAGRAIRGAVGRSPGGTDVLVGRTGLELASRVVAARVGSAGTSGSRGTGSAPSRLTTGGGMLAPGWDGDLDVGGTGHDLTGGLAGLLLALPPDEHGARRAADLLDALAAGTRREPVGCCWPDVADTAPGARPGRPLCGLAHGASGVVLALVETARRFPPLAADALALADDALAWEAAWFDPVGGGWPDLRDGDISAAAPLWCHGAAGIGLVRLVLLAGSPAGAPWPIETVAADAEVAVAAAQRAVQQALTGVAEHGWDAAPGGLTLCHGLGGPLELLLEASRVWGDAELLATTRTAALTLAERLPEDPWEWPGGLREAEGVAGLFVGFAGAALTLARIAHPEAGVVGAALLGLEVGVLTGAG
ncbi:lanthionine synthetase LanC family protein [Auraticoccus monumenti]|uniref:Lanthionine synthetase C-like protein n=1 Tax=Auraticoccus monumenti TaxID=675864 RepID=A0A1G6TPI2_9ACTN|nr:lanthionine synthetase LanC family protein [Auraticoccus monumenti]SDD30245.1 Lanthionine synthetase C-like protein [Auraticoccus monumenti]